VYFISLRMSNDHSIGIAGAPNKKRWWRDDVFVDLDIAAVDSSMVSHCY